jgi:MoxR-like ATPase
VAPVACNDGPVSEVLVEGGPAGRLGSDHLDGQSGGRLGPSRAAEMFEDITHNIATVIEGSALAIEHAVTCLVAEGHLLIEDVPGVGKTSLGKALAASIDCTQRRIQFTSDLLPSDVTGVSIFDSASRSFEFRPGPIFANIVLGDEINRTPPKTQSALLEAMEERQVTADSVTRPLPAPFMVIATQNPIEHEGTYPLPVSELDRFLMRIELGYPPRQLEIELLERHGVTEPLERLRPVVEPDELLLLSEATRTVHCAASVQGYIVDLAAATRAHPALQLGASPRASVALQRAARSWALVHGRDYVMPDDVKQLAPVVLTHRLELRPGLATRVSQLSEVIEEVLDRVPVPGPFPAGSTRTARG